MYLLMFPSTALCHVPIAPLKLTSVVAMVAHGDHNFLSLRSDASNFSNL